MTPSQSKMKTSTFGRRSLAGSVSFGTLALSEVVEENVLLLERYDAAVAADDLNDDDAAGEKARADVAIKAALRADLAMCMMLLLLLLLLVQAQAGKTERSLLSNKSKKRGRRDDHVLDFPVNNRHVRQQLDL